MVRAKPAEGGNEGQAKARFFGSKDLMSLVGSDIWIDLLDVLDLFPNWEVFWGRGQGLWRISSSFNGIDRPSANQPP